MYCNCAHYNRHPSMALPPIHSFGQLLPRGKAVGAHDGAFVADAEVLRHKSGFYNTCTLKRCLQRKMDFKTNATNNVISQLFPLQSSVVTKGLYYFILSDQSKLVEIGCSHKKILFSILNRKLMRTKSFKNVIVWFCVY
jgi:hypothetical protein